MMSDSPLLFVDNLTVIDASYLDHARGLVGESWIVDIALGGTLDEQGMMMDFAHVKRDIKQAIDNSIDHTLIIAQDSPHFEIISDKNDYVKVKFETVSGTIEHHSPKEALTFIPSDSITDASIEHYVKDIITAAVPKNVTQIQCTIRHEIIEGAHYHYSHGLKKHDGNCQRIAHGHRSRIEIWQDGQRNHELESQWAHSFSDIYIGTEDDVIQKTSTHTLFRYQSRQGIFELSIPSTQCYVIAADTTVENISSHIHNKIQLDTPSSLYKVKAFEGLNKGAISS
jgi:6-pyruvoyl-tetrahydropterin synthase